MDSRVIPRPLDNGDITEGPPRDTGTGRWISARYSEIDPLVRMVIKIEMSAFNELQARSFEARIPMAALVREAVAEKLRRER